MYTKNSYLEHHGVKGQKWGIRRYQNEDGTLTHLGKRHKGEDNSYTFVNKTRNNLKKSDNTITRDRAIDAIKLASLSFITSAAVNAGYQYLTNNHREIDWDKVIVMGDLGMLGTAVGMTVGDKISRRRNKQKSN